MTLQSSGTITMAQIAAEFYTLYGGYVYNLNSFRGGAYYSAPVNGTVYYFPSGTISFSNFYGTGGACACDCICDCVCQCGNGSCFLAGALVKMYDGSFKKIEEIIPGDIVCGAFGEPNEILALDWVVLGNRWMYSINDEHTTSNDHPHVGIDKNFYSAERDAIINEWGNYYPVILQNGLTIRLKNRGLSNLDRLKTLEIGNVLQTIWGPKEVKNIKQIKMNEDTKLYNLVVGGSHTYFVDNYAVTGWPREDDFDYDRWIPKDKKLTLEDYLE